ncbi:beta-lactamase family protein [Gammaproteobacteria bacterium]|nr:beta-lactamase family protein [Gammaproteobacteria bacterium]
MEIHGQYDKKFESIVDSFEKQFELGLDIGSSLAVTCEGEMVVDVWAGSRNKAESLPWEEDTIVNVFSSTKNATSLSAYVLADRGQLDFSAPVAKYWPEFAQNGKENILVSHIMSHSSGLPGWDSPVSGQDLYAHDKVAALLEEQEPWWEPGTALGYHAISIGNLMGEIIKRISGKTVGNFFREEIAEPLDIDFHIGLDDKHHSRVAEIHQGIESNPEDMFELEEGSVMQKVMTNGIIAAPDALTAEWRRAEIPAAGGHGNGRSIAESMALMANSGTYKGKRIFSDQLIKFALEEQIRGNDLVLVEPLRWGIGFALPIDNASWMGFLDEGACFWAGWGGSMSIADTTKRISFGYTPCLMEEGAIGSARSQNLVKALANQISKL